MFTAVLFLLTSSTQRNNRDEISAQNRKELHIKIFLPRKITWEVERNGNLITTSSSLFTSDCSTRPNPSLIWNRIFHSFSLISDYTQSENQFSHCEGSLVLAQFQEEQPHRAAEKRKKYQKNREIIKGRKSIFFFKKKTTNFASFQTKNSGKNCFR